MTIKNIRILSTLAMAVVLVVASFAVVGVGVSHAQTTYIAGDGTMYNVPDGYAVSNFGTFYNASKGTYFDPVTGQYSSTAPVGPAARNADGTFIIPAGYIVYDYGAYFNPSTGTYYDPSAGFYSSTAPGGPMIIPPGSGSGAVSTSGTVGLPNTGAGGAAMQTFAALAFVAALGLVGLAISKWAMTIA